MGAFWAWFIGEAGAAWIIGSLSLIVGIIGGVYGYVNRKRPKHIVAEETKRLSLVDIHSSFQDRITVNYKLLVDMPDEQKRTGCIGGALRRSLGQDLKFKTLQQVEFVIYNSGTENFIEPFEFVIDYYPTKDRDTKGIECYWEMFLDDPRAKCNALLPPVDESALDLSVSSSLLNLGCRIELDGLNSWPKERDYIRGYLISEKPVFLGSRHQGLGWSSEYRESKKNRVAAPFYIVWGLLNIFAVIFILPSLISSNDIVTNLTGVLTLGVILGFWFSVINRIEGLIRRFFPTPVDVSEK